MIPGNAGGCWGKRTGHRQRGLNIIGKLKQKLTARRQDGVTRYWQTLATIAKGHLTDRAADEAIEAIEPALVELGKSDQDLEADLALLREHAAAKAAAETAADGRAEAADLRADVARLDEQFKELHGEAERVRAQAEECRNRAMTLTAAADHAAQELARTENRLAAAGYPRFAARAADDAKAREVESLFGELANIEHGFGHSVGQTLDSRRNAIASRLRELGHPVDEDRLRSHCLALGKEHEGRGARCFAVTDAAGSP